MIEKGITIYIDHDLKCFLIVNEIDLGYIDKKIVGYVGKENKSVLNHVLDILGDTQVNIRELQEKLYSGFKNNVGYRNTIKCVSFEIKSNNQNKTSRNKRMLEQEGMKNYVKVVRHVGIKENKYLRKR